jgi:hypothetical protein
VPLILVAAVRRKSWAVKCVRPAARMALVNAVPMESVRRCSVFPVRAGKT